MVMYEKKPFTEEKNDGTSGWIPFLFFVLGLILAKMFFCWRKKLLKKFIII